MATPHCDEIARRLDGIDNRLSSLDDKLGRRPSKAFMATTVIAVGGISRGTALALAALTFNIADDAAKTTQQAEQAKSSPSAATAPPQPIVIVLRTPPGPSPQPDPQPQKPSPPP